VTASPIELAPLTAAEVAEIARWPRYPAPVEALDYALRPGGWLDTFPESPANRRFAVHAGHRLVGFTLLVDIRPDDAEFYIAIHPEMLGEGFGRAATQATAEVAFRDLGLPRIHLKVRVWHEGAIHVYRSIGFKTIGEQVQEIQGRPTAFVLMELTRPAGQSGGQA